MGINPAINATVSIELWANWMGALLATWRGGASWRAVEAKPTAQEAWVQHCKEVAPGTIWSRCSSWYHAYGKSVGKAYWGSWLDYKEALQADNFESLAFRQA
jgi:hypothetical protein